jgi:hypothetical protein
MAAGVRSPPPPCVPFPLPPPTYKEATAPPLHPAPLPFCPHPPAQHHRSTARRRSAAALISSTGASTSLPSLPVSSSSLALFFVLFPCEMVAGRPTLAHRRRAAARRRPSTAVGSAAARHRSSEPSDRESTLQIVPRPESNQDRNGQLSRRLSFCKKGPCGF